MSETILNAPNGAREPDGVDGAGGGEGRTMLDPTSPPASPSTLKRKTARASRRWTRAKQRLFLEALARTSNVAASERKAKMPAGSAYRERHRSPQFDLEWLAALREGYARLEMEMLERARAGVVKRTIKLENGSELLEYSDRGGMALLAAHRATVTAAAYTAAPALDIKARLAAKLAEMDRRERGDE